MRKRWILAGFGIVIALSAGLLLWTDVFRTTVYITAENRSSLAIRVGVSDAEIGCWDSKPVAANTVARLKLQLHGQNVLCFGDAISSLAVSKAGGTDGPEWICFGDDAARTRHIVITDAGLDCTP